MRKSRIKFLKIYDHIVISFSPKLQANLNIYLFSTIWVLKVVEWSILTLTYLLKIILKYLLFQMIPHVLHKFEKLFLVNYFFPSKCVSIYVLMYPFHVRCTNEVQEWWCVLFRLRNPGSLFKINDCKKIRLVSLFTVVLTHTCQTYDICHVCILSNNFVSFYIWRIYVMNLFCFLLSFLLLLR